MDSLVRMQQRYPLQIGADTAVLREICTPVKKITKDIRALATALGELVWAYE